MRYGPFTAALLLGVSLVAGASPAHAQVNVGDRAPDFVLPAATRDTILQSGVRLSDIMGKGNIILAFYPADWSGGCTTEMCTIRDNFAELGSLNARVLGISGDYVFSHRAWARKLELPFMLLSDHDHSVAKTYQSYIPERGLNKRTVFLLDRNGNIAYRDLEYTVKTPDSFMKLRNALTAIQ